MDTTDGIFEENGFFQRNTIFLLREIRCLVRYAWGTGTETKKFCVISDTAPGRMSLAEIVQNGWTLKERKED